MSRFAQLLDSSDLLDLKTTALNYRDVICVVGAEFMSWTAADCTKSRP